MTYSFGKYKFFDFLVFLNSQCVNTLLGENVREEDLDIINLYDKILEDFFLNFSNTTPLEKNIELTLNLTGFFLCKQPFFDGNTRTLRKFIQFVFYNLKYHVNLTYNKGDKPIIPLFYYEYEFCNIDDINNLKRRLTKIE